MVRKKMKAKKVMLSFDKVDSGKIETDFVQCLEEEETGNRREFMDLYEEHAETNASKALGLLNNMEKDSEDIENSAIVSSPLDEIRQCSQELLSSSAEVDEEMAQCVPELPESPLLCAKVSRLKENQRPKFKTTPTRKEIEKAKLEKKKKKRKKKKMKLSNVGDDETKTKRKNPKNSENTDEGMSCSKTKDKEGSWIQCSRVDCLKWRKLPDEIELTTITDRWVCAMNPDESHMECGASQETCDSQIDYDVVYTQFVPGSLVWAKIPGYPWWPGMVEDDPDYNCCYETDDSDVNPISYHVSFVFDKDVSRSWVSYLSIRPFSGTDNPNEANSKFKKNSKSLTKALAQARSAIHLPVKERLEKFSFCVLYKGPFGQTDKEEEDEGVHSNEKMKSSSKVAEGRMKDADKAKDYGENMAVKEQMENAIKKKKKRKRIIESSEDEGEGKGKESIYETDNGASNATRETFDHESKNGKTTKKLMNNECSFKKTNDVEERRSPCERGTKEDISQMEAEDVLKCKPTNEDESEREKTVKEEGVGTKLKQKQAKKLKETGRKNKESESIGKIEKEGNGTIKKKKKKKATEKENKNDAPSMENNENPEKAKRDNPKKVRTEKRKQTKEKETVNEKSEVKKKKKKKICKDGFKPTISSLTNETSSSKTMEPKVEVRVEEEYTVGDKLIFRDSSSEEEGKHDGMASKDKISLSSTKRIIECGNNEKKKTKKMKKANFIASSKALGSVFIQEVTDQVNSSTVSPKKIKSGTKSLHKKTKPVFGKFKAPVKKNQSVLTSQALATSCNQGETNREKTLKNYGSEKNTTPDKLPSDLDNYVSIETLEKDINNLYQELSEGETSGLLERAGKEDETAVSMDFFHDELTLDVTANDASRCLTNSPEY